MRKVLFVKEHYVNDELQSIIVRSTNDLGKATETYNPMCLPKYIKKFMETHAKEMFTGDYDRETLGVVEYIYR